MADIYVVKRNGARELFNIEKIHKVIEWATTNLEGVSLSDIEINIKLNLKDGITSQEIHDLVTESAANLISLEHPNYQYVASRLLNFSIRKNIWYGKNPPKLYDLIKKNIARKVYDPDILNWYTPEEINKIDEFVDHDRDFSLTYSGIRQLCDKYLVQSKETRVIYETPQFAYILISACLFHKYSGQKRLDYIKRAYNYFSKRKISLPTPIMAGVRTTLRSFASCMLADVGDSMNSIFSSVTSVAHAASYRYGIGLNIGRIRAINAPIRQGDVLHTGVIPFLKVFESTIKSCHQNGIRASSANCCAQIFHYEIMDILQLKNNAGTETNRVRGLDYTISISKLFYERFLKNENVTLFSPHETRELYDKFGLPEFDELYVKAEKDASIKMKKVVSARELFSLLIKERIETGRIYILNIDHANEHSPWLDKVNMTNLCVSGDTMLLTKEGHKPIALLENKDVEVWNGKQWSKTTVVKTGDNQRLIRVILEDGTWVDCTPYHKFYVDLNNWSHGSEGSKESDMIETRAIDLKSGQIIHRIWKSSVQYETSLVKVQSVEDLNMSGDTYCVNEPLEHKAVFNGILTGNCVEVLHPTIPLESFEDPNGEIGVCILSSINWLEVTSDHELEKICDIIVRMLDELIDYQTYFNVAAKNFATKRRSLGVGLTNFAAFLAKNNLKYDDSAALTLTDEWMEKQQYYLLKASNQLAREKGKCAAYDLTKYSKGILPIDTYKKEVDSICDRKPSCDWEKLRADIKKDGLRHSTLTCCMPNESSSLIINSTNGIEPPLSLISYKKSKIRTITFVVPHADKWKDRYTLAFQRPSNRGYLNICAVLQKYIDMAMSVNTYYTYPLNDVTALQDMIYHYKMGGKTMYYNNVDDDNKQGLEKLEEVDGCSSGSCKI